MRLLADVRYIVSLSFPSFSLPPSFSFPTKRRGYTIISPVMKEQIENADPRRLDTPGTEYFSPPNDRVSTRARLPSARTRAGDISVRVIMSDAPDVKNVRRALRTAGCTFRPTNLRRRDAPTPFVEEPSRMYIFPYKIPRFVSPPRSEARRAVITEHPGDWRSDERASRSSRANCS